MGRISKTDCLAKCMMCTIIGQYQISFKHCTAIYWSLTALHAQNRNRIHRKKGQKNRLKTTEAVARTAKCTPMPRPRCLLNALSFRYFRTDTKEALHGTPGHSGCVGERVEHSGALGNRIPKWSNAKRKDHESMLRVPRDIFNFPFASNRLNIADHLGPHVVGAHETTHRTQFQCNIRFHSNVLRTFVVIAAAAAPYRWVFIIFHLALMVGCFFFQFVSIYASTKNRMWYWSFKFRFPPVHCLLRQ